MRLLAFNGDDVVALIRSPAAGELDQAFHEALTALQALSLHSARQVALYEELGILGPLIAGPQGISLTDFSVATLGSVIRHDQQNSTRLLDKLRAYLDANCHQGETAERLFVHQKTVRYRLDTIERLTGLRLNEHRDRMRADVTLRALDLS